MKKRTIFIVIVTIIIVVGIIVLMMNILNTSNREVSVLEQKGIELLGNDYCSKDHSLEFGGDALTNWKCMLCGKEDINPDTNTPKLCLDCAKLTKRCNHCGKLKK